MDTLVHLSGSKRGTTDVLEGRTLSVGTAADSDVHFPRGRETAVASRHAILRRDGEDRVLEVAEGETVFVNGEGVSRRSLRSGDLLELGAGGPVLRYREHEGDGSPYKSFQQVLDDCVDCARYGSSSYLGRAGIVLRAMPRELLTQTSPLFRATLLGVMLVLTVATAYLMVRDQELGGRIAEESSRVEGLAELVEETRSDRTLTAAALDSMSEELRSRIATAERRVRQAEARDASVPELIARASRSVAFVQGAYRFVDPPSGRPVRVRTLPDGRRRGEEPGGQEVGPDVSGDVLTRQFTGSAFVVTRQGHMLTNRHLAIPWERDRAAAPLRRMGYEPEMARLLAYLPGREAPVALEVLAASDSADVALLRPTGGVPDVDPLMLATGSARAGDEILVLGYPTGVRALLARTSPAFLDSLRHGGDYGFWRMARVLSESRQIQPLATRGIVGQVTSSAVVYDAETTRGGSGGPVIGTDGRVLAVNKAVMTEFGGSNLGVPAREARRLLRGAGVSTPEDRP